jgi:hypothetical protein
MATPCFRTLAVLCLIGVSACGVSAPQPLDPDAATTEEIRKKRDAGAADAGVVLGVYDSGMPLEFLRDGGDAARLPDGGWDDLYQSPQLGSCVAGSVVIANIVDPDCYAGLIDADRVVTVNGEWVDGGDSNPIYRARPLRIAAYSATGQGALTSRLFSTSSLTYYPAACTARPAIAQIGGRYGVAYVARGDFAVNEISYFPSRVVVGHELSTILREAYAAEPFEGLPGGVSDTVWTYGVSMQAHDKEFRIGFAQTRPLIHDSRGQVISGNVIGTSTSWPGPDERPTAYDMLLGKNVSFYPTSLLDDSWAFAESNDDALAAVAIGEKGTTAFVGKERTSQHAGRYDTLQLAVDGGVALGLGDPRGTIPSPGGGFDSATVEVDGGTRVVHISANGELSAPTEYPVNGSLFQSNGTSWLLGEGITREQKIATLRATSLSPPFAHYEEQFANAWSFRVLQLDAREDRVRVLTAVLDPSSSKPSTGRVVLTTWCK